MKPKVERHDATLEAVEEEIELERATGEGMPDPDPVGPADYGDSDDPDRNTGQEGL